MILLLANKFHYLKGGAERYYLDQSAYLSARGHRVVHLSMAHALNLPAIDGDRFVGEVDYRKPMGLAAQVRHAGRTIYNLEAAAAAREIARQSRPQVAHLHNIYHQLSPSIVRALSSAGIPIVQTLHDYKLICPAYLMLRRGEVCERCRGGRYYHVAAGRCLLDSRGASAVAMAEAYFHRWMRTYEKVRLFLCPSRFMLEKVADFGVPRDRLVRLPYFLPMERFVPAADRGEYLVYAGRLSREKGVATLLEAHARLPEPRLPLRILGDGPLRAELERRAGRLGAGDVSFEGHKELAELTAIVGRARFVVVPSEWYENYPYAILEAFALARPVIGTRIGGIPELVRDGETGRCVPPGDVGAMADAIAGLGGAPAQADAMGKRAREWVERELAPARHMDRLEAIYAELLR